ncbi:hypothetical protein [Pontibacter liquoris]|uniref:hypothetical protein n=1 Tax=Pontibacter liquoris TaxID=2905677 RepID=UPI001FA7084F|nr:hypothetical protein [Pontibacter liquoris]
MKYALYFILACSLFSCQSRDADHAGKQSQTHPATVTATDSTRTQPASPESAPPAAPDSAFLIMPGQGIGHVRLEMPSAALTRILGKPDSGDAAMGKSLQFWISKGANQPRQYVAVYIVTNFNGRDETPKVQQVQVTSPQFKTSSGASTGQQLPEIRKQFGSLFPIAYYTNSRHQQVYIFDSQAQGIAFEVTVPDSTCTAITVHQPNTDVTETYLPVHPDMTRLKKP